MERKERIGDGENENEFIVISQTLVEICEKVCSKIAFDTTSVHHGGVNCENTNVSKVMHCVVKPIVTLTSGENGCSDENGCSGKNGCSGENGCSDENGCSGENGCSDENGCSGEPLDTVVNGCVGDMECNGTSDIHNGALKAVVVLKYSGNGATEQSVSSVDGAIKNGMECDDNSITLKPLLALTPSENKCCGVPSNTDSTGDSVDKSNVECNTIVSTDTVMTDNERKTLLVEENAKDDHHKVNQQFIGTVLDGEAIEEPSCNSTTTQEVIEKTGTDNGDTSFSKDKPRSEKENSAQSCGTNTHSVESETATENACSKVTQVQKADGMNDENVINPCTLKQRRKKKAVSKKNKSIHHQTPPSSSGSASNASGNIVVNDFEFVLSVVQQDLEEIQMTNVIPVAISSEVETNKDSSDDEGESSDTSSSSSTSSAPSILANSKRYTEKHIEEDGDRVHAMNGPPKTRDEVLLSELPPPPELVLMSDKDQIKPIGEIESIINAEAMVIIKSYPDVPALDTDSILFLGNGCSFGQVFEIFGQVRSPHYCVRFKNEEEIREKNVVVGQTVFYAPDAECMTNFVFVSKIQRMKGSDASWKHDQEPPDQLLEYSDDEAESAAKALKKKANKLKHRNQTVIQERDAEKNAKKQRLPNAAADSTPPASSKQPWINQATRQTHQPRQHPVPLNIRPQNPPGEFYSERFPLGQNVPMQFNPRSHLPRPPPQPMPSGVFYNHQRPHQYHTSAPGPPPFQQQPLPPQFYSFQPCIPFAQHGTYPTIPHQSNATNGQPHVPSELSLPRVNLGHYMARPEWPTVHSPTQPQFYCPPR